MLRHILGQAKKHLSLIPPFVFIGAGGGGAALYLLRLTLFNPDVCWDKKNNPEPWNKLGPNDQYKFYSVNVDYSKLKKQKEGSTHKGEGRKRGSRSLHPPGQDLEAARWAGSLNTTPSRPVHLRAPRRAKQRP
ncbi:hypothetical protein P7K49_001184 [Saguinus oedipus]|uniref:Cytochrome c oxidase subunit NDUFA4 n=1 Tax=Saguinus oedipus TaxID=9490 RepID=A0ABQ9WG97_SAGOE|nr:hypothetical protein P7K49_001184 [Saguinus oedipus]